MKPYRLRGEIVGQFVEVEEFTNEQEAKDKFNSWLSIFDDVSLYYEDASEEILICSVY